MKNSSSARQERFGCRLLKEEHRTEGLLIKEERGYYRARDAGSYGEDCIQPG